MGCDIHMKAEFFDESTQSWKVAKQDYEHPCEYCNGTGRDDRKQDEKCWRCAGTKNCRDDWYEGRNYDDFAILADVRNGRGFAGIRTGDGFNPISQPKGIPEDATEEVVEYLESYGPDGHSHSYLTLKELLDFDWTQTTGHMGVVSADVYYDWWKRLGKKGFPATWAGGIHGRNVRNVSNSRMETLFEDGTIPIPSKTPGQLTPELMVESKYITTVQWTETYKESASNLWREHGTIPLLQRYAEKKGLKPEHLRICFFFDN